MVKDILNKCGFINYWNDQFVPRNFNLSKKVKQYVYDSYVEYWKLQIFNAPKCTNYRMYKSEFGLEKYFTILPPDLMYNKEELGDEFHYLFNCTFFKDERKTNIPEYLYNIPNTISFSE